MIRIVGGTLKGRLLRVPEHPDLRPTSNKVREAVFDILQARVPMYGARLLDCCAGTGAVGIEALSRGAAFVEFVEADRKLARAITDNLAALGLSDRALVSISPTPRERNFTVAFLDPPYRIEAPPLTACALATTPGGLLMHESGRREPDDALPAEFLRSYHYGKTSLHLFVIPE